MAGELCWLDCVGTTPNRETKGTERLVPKSQDAPNVVVVRSITNHNNMNEYYCYHVKVT